MSYTVEYAQNLDEHPQKETLVNLKDTNIIQAHGGMDVYISYNDLKGKCVLTQVSEVLG